MVNVCLMHCTGPNIERVHGIGVFSLIEHAAGESDRERKERFNIVTTKEKRNGNRGSPASAGTGTPVSAPVTTPPSTESSVPQGVLMNILSASWATILPQINSSIR